MSAKRFPSKVDSWLVLVFALAMLTQFSAMVAVLLHDNEPWWAVVVIVLTTIGLFLLIGSMLRFTYYAVDGGQLKVVSGPFRWRVGLNEIHRVEPTRSVLSSPALSLDRLRITYGRNRKIMVSPADKPGFLEAIGHGGSRG
jgi:hypothetical protein